MRRSQALISGNKYGDIPRSAYSAIMGRCENRIGRTLFGKKVEGLRFFDYVDEIMKELEAEVQVALTTHICACVIFASAVQSVWASCVGGNVEHCYVDCSGRGLRSGRGRVSRRRERRRMIVKGVEGQW